MTNAGGGRRETAIPGDWNVICDVCGFKWKASQTLERWDGLRVCPYDWEPRHPHDFLRTKEDDQSVPFTRSDLPDADSNFTSVTFIDYSDTDPQGSQSLQLGYGEDDYDAEMYWEDFGDPAGPNGPVGLDPSDPRNPEGC